MRIQITLTLVFSILFFPFNLFASSLSIDAKVRGINETCLNYLDQIEQSYQLSGLKLTFAHPEESSELPSLHISTQIYNNGSSSFSATLIPDEEYCYVSTVNTTAINNQSCDEIAQIKASKDKNLKISVFADGNFTILTPYDESFHAVLTKSGEKGCTMTETRMMWPGR